jgi:hypothetical protein
MSAVEPKVTVKDVNLGAEEKGRSRPNAAVRLNTSRPSGKKI